MLSFALAVFLLIATPGPGVLSAAGMGAAWGFRAGLQYLVGLLIGSNLVVLIVISGLAAALLSASWMRAGLLIASTGYLLYLAAKIAFAGSKIAIVAAERPPGIVSGVVLQLINPKAYAVNTALFTGFIYAPNNLAFETFSKLLIFNLIWIPIHLGWLWAGAALRRLELSERTQRRINYGMAAAMVCVVGLTLFSAQDMGTRQ